PSAAHGVLVELKQKQHTPDLRPVKIPFGAFELTSVNDGQFKLDGGAMFGIVPKALWEKKNHADDRNRILLSMRPLVVDAEWGRMIIDCGAGDKWDAKNADIYGLSTGHRLEQSLAEVGMSTESIDIALPTHLHFDHFGGGTMRDASGALVPRF